MSQKRGSYCSLQANSGRYDPTTAMPITRRIFKTFSRLFHVTQLHKKENWLGWSLNSEPRARPSADRDSNHAFLYISLLSFRDYNVSAYFHVFVEDENTR